ncbi:translation initiation factor IF-2 [Patescibacteria group bacterium]|nr:translation initiation factor IF-2 [Patescibacteria group bacterium]
MNITELARKLKITPKELKQELPNLGFHIGPRAIQIPDKQAEKVMEIWQEKKKLEATLKKVQEKIFQRKKEKEEEIEEKPVIISSKIQVYRLAEELNITITKLMNELMKNGVLASVNESLDYEVAAIIAENLGFKVELGELENKESVTLLKQKLEEVLSNENKDKLQPRAPVVVIMGHVDHGKSSILDAIRESKIVAGEKGGITQHIGAYQVETNNHLITFIDTPGHEAFQSMRARGGEVADIAILVIAADDKIQPQTLESIKIIQQKNLPFIVAINKIDKPDSNVKKIKKELSDINLMPEDWGGKVICVEVSAKTKKGIDNLLEMINLVSEMITDKLVTNPDGDLVATVIESHLDLGFGPVATLIVYYGMLKKGDNIIIGQSYGQLRAIKDQSGKLIEKVGAGLPVQIFGLKSIPEVGNLVEVIPDNREFKKRVKQIPQSLAKRNSLIIGHQEKLTKEEEGDELKKSKIQHLNIILRADVVGSLEAIIHSLQKLEHPEVKIKIIKKGLSNLTESDVDLAKTVNAWIIAFGVGITSLAKQLVSELNLKMNTYYVIYDLIQDVKEEVNKLLPEEIFEEDLGKLEVLKIFQSKAKETILGGKVTKGKIIKATLIRVWSSAEKQELKGEGKVVQLQINKQDVEEVKTGGECGIKVVGQVNIEINDILEVYREVKKQRKI